MHFRICNKKKKIKKTWRPRQLSHGGTEITQDRPSLDAFVIAQAALPRKEKTKKKSFGDDAEE